MNLRIFLAIFAFVSLSNGYKILFLGPMNGKSHFLFLQSFVRELIQRGHEVTFVTSNSLQHLNLTNYTEVLIEPLDISAFMSQEKLFQSATNSPFRMVFELASFPTTFSTHSLADANVQKLIHRNDLHFDVVINEEFFHDAFNMFAYKFNAPLVTICPYGMSDFFDRQHGLLTPWSHVPHMTLTFSDNMSFFERWYNTALSIFDAILRKLYYIPNQEALAKKHFAHLEPLPSIEEINRNVSIILANTHSSLYPARPSMPSIINIGGAHVKPAKPLPTDMKKFLDGAQHGAIYFSLGTVVKGSSMPKEKLAVFLSVFSKIKQRVLWKYEDDSLTDIPSNVMISKWMPQNDILAHPNVKLFITHSGLFGTFEALARGVPMLMIPFFGDQHRNAKRVVNAGYGKLLEFNDINEESLKESLQELTTSKTYQSKAKELSALFNHNLVHPMDEAMWWIEYVCKFKGAKHLKSHAVNMSWFSYLLLDVVIVTLVGVLVIAFAFIYLFKKICCNSTKRPVSNKKTN